MDGVGAVASHSSAQRSPNLPHEATTAGSPGTTRLATADSIAPVPVAAKESTSLLGLEDERQALQHPGIDLDEGRRPVIEDRLGHHLAETLGGNGVGPAVNMYCLPKISGGRPSRSG